MKCFNCGAELTEDTKFCSYCGAKVTAPEVSKEEPVKEKVSEPQVDEVDEDIYDEDEVEEVEETEDEYEEPVPPYSTAQKPKSVSTAKPTLGDKAKSKFKEFWNGLSTFGKLSTISIALASFLCLIAFLAGRIFAGIIAIVWIAVGVVAILMKKDVIKVPKTWIPLLAIILSFVLIVPYFSLFKINIADYEKYNWDEIVLADMLPTPESPYGEIISNSDNYLAVYVTKSTQNEYTRYIEACKEKGFTIDTETSGSFFYAYNEQGYKLSLSYYDYSSEMHISLSAGTEYGILEWSNSELAKMLPAPTTTTGDIQKDDEKGFSAYLGNTAIDAFNAYVEACKEKGFTVDTDSTDKRFSAKNADGYKLSVEYQGNNVVYVSLAVPEYSVSIEIECVENLIFSKYDVDVYVDDSLEGTVSHGDTETFELTLTKGTYVLKFVNEDDDDVDGKVEFYIEKDENLKYKISCTSSKVNVETIAGTTTPNTNNNQQGTSDYTLDYQDAESFEAALNNGDKVNGKIVQFVVNDYKPDSALGINCWAGEHLNFISDNELSVSAGDVIIGKVTAEPSKVLGSWKIPYEVLNITEGEEAPRTQKNGFDSSSNETYTLAGYTIEIPKYWKSENKIDGGFQRYAETSGKVAMLQVAAQAETDDSYPVTFDGLMSDNDNMIAMIESTAFKDVTDYEVIDTGVIKGILYKGTIVDKESGLSGYGEWFAFASEGDRTWCTLILCQTDNTEYTYTDDFMKIIKSIKVKGTKGGNTDDTPTTPTNTAGAPDDWTNLLEKHYEEVKKQFEDAGFTNVTCVAHEIDYNENNVFEGSVVNIAIGENGEICTFAKGEQWDKDIKIRIDYRVKPAKPASEYEFAFVRKLSNYSLYYMFDTDNKTVVQFGTDDTYLYKGTYTGSFSSGVTMTWDHGEWTDKFKYSEGSSKATYIDGYGTSWDYTVCDIEDAQEILDTRER